MTTGATHTGRPHPEKYNHHQLVYSKYAGLLSARSARASLPRGWWRRWHAEGSGGSRTSAELAGV